MTKAKLLDSKRSQNLGIMINSRHLDITDVESAVLHLDTSEISLDLLQQICETRATDSELNTIQRHLEQTNAVPLDKPEQFLYDLSHIPHFVDRVFCLAFQNSFRENVSSMEAKLTNLNSICEWLMTSLELQDLLALVLAMGNYMNGGSATRGQADGFELDVLCKLRDVKSRDTSITLLHYIVTKYIQTHEENLQCPLPSSWDVDRCQMVNFDDLDASLCKLTSDLLQCERRSTKVMEYSEERFSEPFKSTMLAFLETCRSELDTQKENISASNKKFQTLCRFFQWPSSKVSSEATPEKFFSMWLPFCSDFTDIYKRQCAKRAEAKLKDKKKLAISNKKKSEGLKARLKL